MKSRASDQDRDYLVKEYGQQYRKLKDMVHADKIKSKIQKEPVSRVTLILGIIGIILLIILFI